MRKFNYTIFFFVFFKNPTEFCSFNKMDLFWINFDSGNQNSGWNSGGAASAGWGNYEGYGEHGAHSQPIGQQIAYTGHKAVRR